MLYATNIDALNPPPPGISIDSLPMSWRTGSGIVSSTNGAKLVGIVNQDNRGLPADNNNQPVQENNIGKGVTSNMGILGQETNKVFFSQVPKNAGVPPTFTGGVIVANATGTAGKCQFSFTGYQTGSVDIKIQNRLWPNGIVDLPANGQISFYMERVGPTRDEYGLVTKKRNQRFGWLRL